MRTIYSTLVLCALTGAFLGIMEWLFFATKPSFLTVFSTDQRILSLLGTVSILAALTVVAGLLLLTIARLIFFRLPKLELHLPSIAPSIALTVTSLLLADNFSNTVLSFGSEDSIGFFRIIYLLLIVGCLVLYTIICGRWVAKYSSLGPRHFFVTTVILGVFLATTFTNTGDHAHQQKSHRTGESGSPALNILVIGSDGVNARNLSLYGYHRKTTPFLEKLAAESVWALNAFSNSAHTGGSIISMLTGKLPFESGVIYAPDVLQGRNSYESLPALLRSQYSYRTFQASFPHYADALDLNLKNAFDVVNSRSGIEDLSASFSANHLGEATSLLLKTIFDRLRTRLLHIFHIQDSYDAFAEVTGKATSNLRVSDRQRIDNLLGFIDTSPDPFFAHVHLMGTHGPSFRPRIRKYSIGLEQTDRMMPDFYDDSIADFDRYLEEVYEKLRQRDLLGSTAMVVYSDHGIRYTTHVQLPLLFRVPGQASGTITNNVQNLDIPKTILHILRIPAPSWLGGRSLFNEALDPCYPILSTAAADKGAKAQISFDGLPSLGRLRLLAGRSMYQWNLLNDVVRIFEVHYETQQPDCPAWSENDIRAFFRQRLAEAGHKPSIE